MRAELITPKPKDAERLNARLDDKGRAIQTDMDMATTLRMLKSRLNKTVTPCALPNCSCCSTIARLSRCSFATWSLRA